MARKAVLMRNEKRRLLIERYAKRREELRRVLRDPRADAAAKMQAQTELQKMPRDSCKARYRNRCRITGRSRGVFRRFGISRSILRELSMNGEIPGVTKSSW